MPAETLARLPDRQHLLNEAEDHKCIQAAVDGAYRQTLIETKERLSASDFVVHYALKVVATTDEAIVVKIGRTQFAVLDRELVTDIPIEGAKVAVQPYARRRFDGSRADTPEEVVEHTSDGTPYKVTRLILGSAPALLPVAKPECLELQQLIEQLESMPAPDRHRTISHMLVDAHASDFTLVDPHRRTSSVLRRRSASMWPPVSSSAA